MFYKNGELVDSNIQMGNYTSYPSSFLVVDPDGIFSKHYYAGTQRIAARIGDKNADELFADKKKSAKLHGTDSTDNTFNPEELKTLQQKDLQFYLDKAGKVARLSFKKYKSAESEVQEQQQENENNYVAYGAMAEELIYYYHPDHLGTATYLTDINGEAYEFFLNLPFGETMAEQHSQTADYVNRWKFTGHELDRETGLYYANARYYDPKLSIFLSVDMLAEQAPGWTPYRYGFNNPIRYTDPTGMFEIDGDGWYKDGDLYIYDSRINSQDNLNSHGIEGTYIGDDFYDFNALQSGDAQGNLTDLSTGYSSRFIDGVEITDKVVFDIYRDTQTQNSTTGSFTFGNVEGFTLERPGPDTTTSGIRLRIPSGEYNVSLHNGSKYKNVLKLFNDQVPESRAILVHNGNYPSHTDGCILVGGTRGTDFIGGSVGKLNEVRSVFKGMNVEDIKIRVHNNLPEGRIPYRN